MPLLILIFLCLFVAPAFADTATSADKNGGQTLETPKDSNNETLTPANKKDTENPGKIDPAERMITPITSWLEKQAHKSTILNPGHENDDALIKHENNKMRAAIMTAQQRHPGTVLSAKRVEHDNAILFSIKIISSTGTIKELNISDSDISNGTSQ